MNQSTYSTLDVRSRAVEALSRGLSIGHVADVFGVDRTTRYRWRRRVEEQGDLGLLRQPGSGRPRKLVELDHEELRAIVLQPASTFGFETDLWTVGRLHQVLEERYELRVSRDTVWRRLRESRLTYQKPEREYYESNEQVRAKWLRYEVPKIRQCIEKHRALLYF